MKLLLLSGLMTCLAGPVLADFKICNETGSKAFAALGYKADDQWRSEGWWAIEPNQCSTPIVGDLQNRYYYLFARSAIGRWSGDYTFCYADEEFEILGDTDCTQRGYKTGGFLQIDTGGDEIRDWTQNLSD